MTTLTDLRPMLAGSVNPRELPKYCENDRWAAEQKIDGMRLVIETTDTGANFLNRKGETFKQYLPADLAQKMGTLGAGFVLDGELVEDTRGRRTLFLFDLLDTPAGTTVQKPFKLRRNLLEHVCSIWSQPGVEILPSYTGRIEKLSLAKTLLGNGGEGVMVRDQEGIYVPGLRSPALLKAKFVKTVDCIVLGKGRNGKDNVVLGLHNDVGTIVDIGEVTALAGDGATLEEGEVCEIQYLYAVDPARPRLVQPTRPTRRTDKTPDECLMSQIQFTSKTVLRAADLNL